MDKEVLSALAYFQEHLEEMSIRFQKLKDITYQLYKENEELKNENEELKEIIFARKKEKKERLLPISSICIRKGIMSVIPVLPKGARATVSFVSS